MAVRRARAVRGRNEGRWLQEEVGKSVTAKLERRLVLVLCLLCDAAILWAAMDIATLSRLPTLVYLDSLWLLQRDQLVCLVVYLLGIAIAGAYNPVRITDRFDCVYFTCLGLAGAAVPVLVVARAIPREYLAISGRELVIGPVLGAVALCWWRFYFAGLASRFRSVHRSFYVLGDETEGRRIAAGISARQDVRAEARYMGFDALKAALAELDNGAKPMTGRAAIIVGAPENRREAVAILELCEAHFGRTFLYPSLQDLIFFGRSRLLAIAGVPLVEVANRQLFSPYVYCKRGVDLFCAGVGLLLASPICVTTAVAIKVTSPGPILYTQERMGLNGKRFRLYKFRSMVTDAESKTGPVWARSNDARVTPVGQFIRKHRIDEIPQLVNVLKGDMSLIGPRPERPHFHQEFCEKWPLFQRRLMVRPGVTSLSHVLGSYDSEPSDRLRYDIMYISSLSLLNDLKILIATVRVVLGAKGAQ